MVTFLAFDQTRTQWWFTDACSPWVLAPTQSCNSSLKLWRLEFQPIHHRHNRRRKSFWLQRHDVAHLCIKSWQQKEKEVHLGKWCLFSFLFLIPFLSRCWPCYWELGCSLRPGATGTDNGAWSVALQAQPNILLFFSFQSNSLLSSGPQPLRHLPHEQTRHRQVAVDFHATFN